MPDLEYQKEFVIYANAKGMLVAHNVAAYFCEEHNPMYDAKRAAAEGYKMFCQPGECPFDLLKYGMTKGIPERKRNTASILGLYSPLLLM